MPMLARRTLRWIALSSLLALVAPLAQAQPVVDGMTVGIGLSSYHGDLDWNPTDGPAEFLAAANLGAFVAADRSFGPIITEAALRYDHYAIDYPQVEMSLNTASLELTAGYAFDLIQPLFLRVFAGVAPMVVMPRYDRVDQEVLDRSILTFEQQGTTLQMSFPVGIVVQDVLRLGVRFMFSDDFDGATGTSGASDFVTFVSVGYRFDLLKP